MCPYKPEVEKNNKHICIGLLAHVDTGKTTLSEAMLYLSGAIRKAGRVDHRNAFLDNNAIEQERGITVFSKEARFELGEKSFTLLDTPGHFDFSAEMERTLHVLDCAILLVSGTDGVQSHTETLWQLLERYDVPVVIFVNKMDRPDTDSDAIMKELVDSFGDGFVKIGANGSFDNEDAALTDEIVMSAYLESGEITDELMAHAVRKRRLFPVCFGSALKMEGVDNLLAVLNRFVAGKDVSDEFGAIVYKISYDRQGVRQTHLRLTGGTLRCRQQIETAYGSEGGSFGDIDVIDGADREPEEETGKNGQSGQIGQNSKNIKNGKVGKNGKLEKFEKVDRIRLYSGNSCSSVSELEAGMVGAVTGLENTYAGQRLGSAFNTAAHSGFHTGSGTAGGIEAAFLQETEPLLKPALTYRMLLPDGEEPAQVMMKLRRLEEEEPTLCLVWNEEVGEIHVQVMGPLELEVLKRLIKERFELEVDFGEGSVIYKETILDSVIGIGHYEPLRHYAEVQLLMEPLPQGSGVIIDSLCSEDKLDRNWQRLILTHLAEKSHRGILTGSELTDVKISIIAGRAHLKHTEGGDFRQATYRAVRQGLCKAENILLEPYYSFRLEVPYENVGRALTDMQRLGAEVGLPEIKDDSDINVIRGKGPVSKLHDYQNECSTYTRGRGRFMTRPAGMFPCVDSERVIEQRKYIADEDFENPSGSVFCEHGAAVYVPWDEVDERAHVDSGYVVSEGKLVRKSEARSNAGLSAGAYQLTAAGERELEEIFLRTYGRSKRDEALRREALSSRTHRPAKPVSSSFPQPKWKKNGSGTLHEGCNHGSNAYEYNEDMPFFVVDGYNVIFAWEELKELAAVNLDSAREALLDILQNYAGYKKVAMFVVFDGYKVAGNPGTRMDYGLVKAVYTKEAETADRFIEKTVFELGRRYDVTVVTSDRPVQMAALGDGARRLSSREFYAEVSMASDEIREKLGRQKKIHNRPFEAKFDK